MKRFIYNIITFPYRLFMLLDGRMLFCRTCWSIVWGGFGSPYDGYICVECVQKEWNKEVHKVESELDNLKEF